MGIREESRDLSRDFFDPCYISLYEHIISAKIKTCPVKQVISADKQHFSKQGGEGQAEILQPFGMRI